MSTIYSFGDFYCFGIICVTVPLSQLSIHYGTHMYPSAVISIVFVTACSQKLLSYLACGLVMSEASTLRVEPATGQRSRAVEEVR